ncbi:unnamed protein product, partial [Notodromas monacha]
MERPPADFIDIRSSSFFDSLADLDSTSIEDFCIDSNLMTSTVESRVPEVKPLNSAGHSHASSETSQAGATQPSVRAAGPFMVSLESKQSSFSSAVSPRRKAVVVGPTHANAKMIRISSDALTRTTPVSGSMVTLNNAKFIAVPLASSSANPGNVSTDAGTRPQLVKRFIPSVTNLGNGKILKFIVAPRPKPQSQAPSPVVVPVPANVVQGPRLIRPTSVIPISFASDSTSGSIQSKTSSGCQILQVKKPLLVTTGLPTSSVASRIEVPGGVRMAAQKSNVNHYIEINGKLTPIQISVPSSSISTVPIRKPPASPQRQLKLSPTSIPTSKLTASETALLDHNFTFKTLVKKHLKPRSPSRQDEKNEIDVVDELENGEIGILDQKNDLKRKKMDLLRRETDEKPEIVAELNDKRDAKKSKLVRKVAERKRKTCNCAKSMCLKLYCDCFASGEFCDGCNCVNCFNNLDHEEERQRVVALMLERNPSAFRPKIGAVDDGKRHNRGCNCKRTYCIKNYCECFEHVILNIRLMTGILARKIKYCMTIIFSKFKAKILCTHLCRCNGCKNQGDETSRQVLVKLCDAADHEAKKRLQNRPVNRFSRPETSEPAFPHTLTPDTFSFHASPDLDGVWDYFRGEVIEATCMCLLGKARECVEQGMQGGKLEEAVINECKLCIDQIIQHAQGEQVHFQKMQQAAERAADKLKQSVQMYSGERRGKGLNLSKLSTPNALLKSYDEEESSWVLLSMPSHVTELISESCSCFLQTVTMERHVHCENCYVTPEFGVLNPRKFNRWTTGDGDGSKHVALCAWEERCKFIHCENLCGSVFHGCKLDEHKKLCSMELVPCVNAGVVLLSTQKNTFTAAKMAANVAAVKAAVDENGGIALNDLEATLRKNA